MKTTIRKIWINKTHFAKQAFSLTSGFYAILGFLSIFFSFCDLLPDTAPIPNKIAISAGIVLLVWGGAFTYFAFRFCKKKQHEVFDVGNNCHVFVQYGDIFSPDEVLNSEERRNIVIPVNRCFDTIVDDDLVSSKTLHGQAMKRLFSAGLYDEESLSNELQANLKEQGVLGILLTKSEKKKGNLLRYPVGSIAELSVSQYETYFFVGLSTFDCNLEAYTSDVDYVTAMMRLIEYCNRRSQGYPVVVPLMGAGLSRAHKNEHDILEYFVKLLKMNKELIKCDIHIVVRNSGKKTIPIANL